MNVLFYPDVEDYLFHLIEILFEKGYFSYPENAENYVSKLISDIENNIAFKQKKAAPKRFQKYATHYIIYKSSKRTTWYIFFLHKNDKYIITYITNSHVSGHHIRGL